MNEIPSLPLEKALELISLADGNLCVRNLPILSLPCVVESRNLPDRSVIVTHLERAREEYIRALCDKPQVRLQFVVGFHYIDPSWIPRSPHAPTEVKAAFEIIGQAKLLERHHDETLSMLQKVTEAKQAMFAPESEWSVQGLPSQYTERLFPMIAEVEIEIQEFQLSRLMVLQHLSAEHRGQILAKICETANACTRAVRRLFEVAYR